MSLPDFSRERALAQLHGGPVAGVDEAGRGPLAGPVAAAAVILDPRCQPKGLDDSKKLTAARRSVLYDEIMESALAVAISFGSVEEIERLNIRGATLLAMRRALAALSVAPAAALIDGRDVPPGVICHGEALIGGDAKSCSVAAASIIAKVTRDRLMAGLDPVYPAYGFARHAGYGTKAHLDAIRIHGPCAVHRRGFAPFRLWEGGLSPGFAKV